MKREMDRLRDSIEEMVRFTLEYSTDFDLGFTDDFCSGLLSGESLLNAGERIESLDTVEAFGGVPEYPLYKRLALGLVKSIGSGSFCRTFEKVSLVKEVIWLKEKEDEWRKLIIQEGFELVNASHSRLYFKKHQFFWP